MHSFTTLKNVFTMTAEIGVLCQYTTIHYFQKNLLARDCEEAAFFWRHANKVCIYEKMSFYKLLVDLLIRVEIDDKFEMSGHWLKTKKNDKSVVIGYKTNQTNKNKEDVASRRQGCECMVTINFTTQQKIPEKCRFPYLCWMMNFKTCVSYPLAVMGNSHWSMYNKVVFVSWTGQVFNWAQFQLVGVGQGYQ